MPTGHQWVGLRRTVGPEFCGVRKAIWSQLANMYPVLFRGPKIGTSVRTLYMSALCCGKWYHETYGVRLSTGQVFPDGRNGIGGFGSQFRSFRCRGHAEEEHDDEEEN